MLRKVLDDWLVIPVGKNATEDSYMLTLTESCAYLWKMLENEAGEGELIEALLDRYEVDRETAAGDVRKFLTDLKRENLLIS
jgi:hypothetical protein